MQELRESFTIKDHLRICKRKTIKQSTSNFSNFLEVEISFAGVDKPAPVFFILLFQITVWKNIKYPRYVRETDELIFHLYKKMQLLFYFITWNDFRLSNNQMIQFFNTKPITVDLCRDVFCDKGSLPSNFVSGESSFSIFKIETNQWRVLKHFE